ncbi:MAG: caspase domain-containing protein [Gemmataceae bacterium]
MRLLFRKLDSETVPPAPGEVYVLPEAPDQRQRRDLAGFVLQHGWQALWRGPGEPECLVVNVSGIGPTLDDMLAATFAQHLAAGKSLPAEAKAYAEYARLMRRGHSPPKGIPVEESIDGIFLTIRTLAGEDLTEPETAAEFAADWAKMADCLLQAAANGLDPFQASPFAGRSDYARERAYLERDRDVFRRDVARGEQWAVTLPGDPPTHGTALFLRRPKSILFKHWSRRDHDAIGNHWVLLAVHWGKGQWVFSTDPVDKLPILGLAEKLQQEEAWVDAHYAAQYPWFDGKPFKHTLVASSRPGSSLNEVTVTRIVRQWCAARPLQGKAEPPPTSKPIPRRMRYALLSAAPLVLLGALGLNVLLPLHKSNKSTQGSVPVPAPAPVIPDFSHFRAVRDTVNQLPVGYDKKDIDLSRGVEFTPDHTGERRPYHFWVALTSPSGQVLPNIHMLEVEVNGMRHTLPVRREGDEFLSEQLAAEFVPGTNRVLVRVADPGPMAQQATIEAYWRQDSNVPVNLFVVAAGVSTYQEQKRNLRYAHADAAALTRAFQGLEGGLFNKVTCTRLMNEQATGAAILAALDQLHTHAKKGQLRDNDLVIVALSGHGQKSQYDTFYFVPHDYDSQAEAPRKTALSWNQMNEVLSNLPCLVIVLLDTCHSGAVTREMFGAIHTRGAEVPTDLEQAVANAKQQFVNQGGKGIIVMASCLGEQLAQEREEWQHGAMTLALLEGLQGKRLYSAKGETPLPQVPPSKPVITLELLHDYVKKRVKELIAAEEDPGKPLQAVIANQTGNIDYDLVPMSLMWKPVPPP